MSLREKMPGDQLYKFARVIRATDADALHRQIVSIWKTPSALVVDAHEAPRTPPFTSDLCRPTFTERMMYSDLVSYLPSDILVKVDRASMGVGLEARCPLLDHRVVEFAWRLPLKYKTRHGQTKWILKQVLHQYVPQILVERPKMGFGVPIDAWLRGSLKEWANELLDENRLKQDGYFHPEPIRKVWSEHLAGSLNHQHRLWTILMFQAWKEQWLS